MKNKYIESLNADLKSKAENYNELISKYSKQEEVINSINNNTVKLNNEYDEKLKEITVNLLEVTKKLEEQTIEYNNYKKENDLKIEEMIKVEEIVKTEHETQIKLLKDNINDLISSEHGLIPMPQCSGKRIFFTPISSRRNLITFSASAESAFHSIPA